MRRSDHPNRPSAITCCFLSSLKTLLTLAQGNSRVRINVLDQTFVGRFSSDNHWPHLSDYRGCVAKALLHSKVYFNTGGKGEIRKAPISLQDLRRRLYIKAKAEPTWRFWGLYVHVCKQETLRESLSVSQSQQRDTRN